MISRRGRPLCRPVHRFPTSRRGGPEAAPYTITKERP